MARPKKEPTEVMLITSNEVESVCITRMSPAEAKAWIANNTETVCRIVVGYEVRPETEISLVAVDPPKPRRRPIRNVDPVLTDKPKRGRKASTNGVEKTDARLNREVVVTEKIDGTNGVVYVSDDGAVIAGSAVES